jgi:hypothetical protein
MRAETRSAGRETVFQHKSQPDRDSNSVAESLYKLRCPARLYLLCLGRDTFNLFYCTLYFISGTGELSQYRDLLQAGRSGVRIPVGGEIFSNRPDRPWGPPSLLYKGYRVFPEVKAAGAWR